MTLNRHSSKQGATVRKRWTGVATSVLLIASALAVQGTIAAKADHAPGGSWTLFAAGDIADPDSGSDELNAALIKAGIAADPDHTRVLMLGDGAYPDGSLATYEREYGKAGSWGDFRDKTYPVPGNHDYGRSMDTTIAGYRQYWQSRLEPLGAASGGNTMGDDGGWYSFDLGNWHIIALNWACGDQTKVVCGVDGPQGRWLQEDLNKAKAGNKHILAMWHGARFFSQNDNGPRVTTDFAGPSSDSGKTNPYWRMLQAAGADVVLGAHHHNYERFARMSVEETDLGKQGSVDSNGMRQFVVGTGGGELMKFTDFAPARGSEARVDNSFGVLKLVLHENSYEWQFLSSGSPGEQPAGTVLDSGSDVTHSTIPGSGGTTNTTGGSTTSTTAPSNPAPGNGSGYWMVGADGKVYGFGNAQKYGDAGLTPGTSAADLEPTPTGHGYWVVDDAGGVASFGDAVYRGSPDSVTIKGDEKVTSLSSTSTGKGYWMFTNKGRVLTFGDATHGSATGWWRRTAASSPSTLPSGARWAASR
jgi:hypothetical protein